MYRFDNSGEIGAPWGTPRFPSFARVVRRFPPRPSSSSSRRDQPLLDQRQHLPVADPPGHRAHQLRMRNRIEVAGQVRVHHLMMPPAHQPLHFPHRLLRVALRTVGILLRGQVRLEDRIQHQHRRRLHHPVAYRRNPQRTLLPIPLRYPHPPHRRGTVGLLPQLPRQLPKPLPHTPRLDALERLAVHTRSPARSAAAFEGVGQHVRPVHLVVELVEAKLRFRLRFRMQRLPQLLDTGRCSQAHRQSPLAHSFRRSFQTKGPSLPRHYPRSSVLRPSPPPRPADSAPHDAAVGPYRIRPPTGASRVAHPPLYMHAVATTPAEPQGCSRRSLPLVAAAFSLSWRDRLPRSLFSGPARRSLRVTACMLAESLRTLFSECFSCFVASTTVPSATGWNDTCRAGIAPAERVCLCTAHQDARAPGKSRARNWAQLQG